MSSDEPNMKKIIIQCSRSKREDARTFFGQNGKPVKFVAHPELCDTSQPFIFCRPDDYLPRSNISWRQYLKSYNRQGTNSAGLSRAADLYKPEIYRLLADLFGLENTYILSAGWGLVRASFLIPDCDITFSRRAGSSYRRTEIDEYNDFNQLLRDGSVSRNDDIYFFGGRDYLPLLYKLTRFLPEKKVVYYQSAEIPREEDLSYEYIRYHTKQRSNWHHACAMDFIREHEKR